MAQQLYTVVITNQYGDSEIVANGCTLSYAKTVAAQEADKAEAAGQGQQVFVKWFRKSDGQVGYLNRGGNHAITGKAW